MKHLTWHHWPHLYEMQQLSRSALEAIIRHSLQFEEALSLDRSIETVRLSKLRRRRNDNTEAPRVLRSLFYQASTRTEGTFFSAATELGCIVHAVKDPTAFSSVSSSQAKDSKGEGLSLATMAYTAAGGMGFLRGCDGVIMRHPEQGAIKHAINTVELALGHIMQQKPIFVINAGDGKYGQHPTQCITDLTTIYKKRGGSDRFLRDLTIFFPGDIRRSRVIRSLLFALGHYGNEYKINVLFSHPDGLGPENDILQHMTRQHVGYSFVQPEKVADVVSDIDIWYSTRDQREHDSAEEQAGKKLDHKRECFVFRREYLDRLRPGAFVMHPLPINEDPTDPPPEIDPALIPLAIAGDERLAFCQTSQLHIPTRAALLDLIFAGLDELAVAV